MQRGDADAMITGGTEAPITIWQLQVSVQVERFSTNDDIETACRPFQEGRDGFVMGEGAGILVIEPLESAQARGANIYAEMIGMVLQVMLIILQHRLQKVKAVPRAMQAAMDDAGIEPKDVQYLNAHGTSTPVGDLNEVKAIKIHLVKQLNT